MEVTVKKQYKGFRKAYGKLTLDQKTEATGRLWAALDVKNRNSFHAYRNGTIEPKVSRAAAVEQVFKSYGITQVWD